MQKNLYFRTILRRENILKKGIYDTFLAIASFPRLLIEVFIRKNFGERYFSFAASVTVTIILAAIPYFLNKLSSGFRFRGQEENSFWSVYATWYLFLIAFLYFALKRRNEIRRNPSVFDFERFSLCSGAIHPFFYKIQFSNKAPSQRTVETIYEPLLFFVGGLILMSIGQKIGVVILISSVCYSLGYLAAYHDGDNFVMDKIDEIILNEELENTFVNDLPDEQTRGVRIYATKPTAKDLREKVAKAFLETDEPTFAL